MAEADRVRKRTRRWKVRDVFAGRKGDKEMTLSLKGRWPKWRWGALLQTVLTMKKAPMQYFTVEQPTMDATGV